MYFEFSSLGNKNLVAPLINPTPKIVSASSTVCIFQKYAFVYRTPYKSFVGSTRLLTNMWLFSRENKK